MRAWCVGALVSAAVLILSACGSSPVSVTHVRVPTLKGGPASFDIVEIDQRAHRLYETDRSDSGVDVFDTSSRPAKFVTTIDLPAEPNGLAVAPDLGLVFAGLSDGSVAFIDPTTNSLTKQVATGAKSVDLIEYAPTLHTVFASTGAEGGIASIDARSGARNAVFKIGYALEQPRFNPADRLLYVTSPGADAVYRVDPKTGRVMDKLPLGGCSPRGLAIDPRQDQALIACSSWVMRMNLRNPSEVKGFTQVGGGDVVSYDAAADRFLVAAPNAKSSEVALFGGNPIDYMTSVATAGMGNSAAYDEKSGVVYTPDVMPGRMGLDAFSPAEGDVVFSSIPNTAMAVFGAMLAAVVVLVLAVGRLADPAGRRPAPAAPGAAVLAAAAQGVRPGARKWVRPKPSE